MRYTKYVLLTLLPKTSEGNKSCTVPATGAMTGQRTIYSQCDNPLTPTVAIGTAIKHPVPDRVKPSFVIFDIRTL